MKTKPIILVNETEGKKFKIAGGNYRIIISGKETDGAFAVIEMSVPPGAGPNPHSHPDFNESFYVLEGEVSFKSESGSYVAKKNSYVNIPQGGVVHGFKNRSDKPAKLLCTVTPAGLEDFFEEVAGFLEANQKTDVSEKMNSISQKYGQTLYPENYLD
ncbi:MAG: cupin domain-containing protein [Flavobacterium sp.]